MSSSQNDNDLKLLDGYHIFPKVNTVSCSWLVVSLLKEFVPVNTGACTLILMTVVEDTSLN